MVSLLTLNDNYIISILTIFTKIANIDPELLPGLGRKSCVFKVALINKYIHKSVIRKYLTDCIWKRKSDNFPLKTWERWVLPTMHYTAKGLIVTRAKFSLDFASDLRFKVLNNGPNLPPPCPKHHHCLILGTSFWGCEARAWLNNEGLVMILRWGFWKVNLPTVQTTVFKRNQLHFSNPFPVL